MFIPTPHGARAVINFGAGSEAYSNVLHFTKTNFSEADMTALAEEIDNQIPAQWLPIMSAEAAYRNVTVYDIRTSDGPLVLVDTNADVGDVAGDHWPINVAVVITLRTAARGRSGRGRLYFGGGPVGWFADGELNPAYYESYEDAVNGIMTSCAAIGWTLCIRSTQQDNVQLASAVMRPVIAVEIRNPKPGTQRRRVDRP